jgi:hypothetical protein
VALGLIGLGVASLMPIAVDGLIRRINAPETKRGSRRRLRGIRDAGLATAGLVEADPYWDQDAP